MGITSFLRFFVSIAILGATMAFITYFTNPEIPVHEGGIVLVTGCSSGIGRDAAKELANQGFFVFAGVRSDADAKSIESLKISKLVPIKLDITSQDDVDRVRQSVQSKSKELKLPFIGLVNNAGIWKGGIFEYQKLSDVQSCFEVNVIGSIRVTQAFLPLLRTNSGRIIMISSIDSYLFYPGCGAYCPSKAALDSFTHILRRELSTSTTPQVSVSIVHPGSVNSEIWNKVLDNSKASNHQELSSEQYQSYKATIDMIDDVTAKEIKMYEFPNVTTTPAIVHALTSNRPKAHYFVAHVDGLPTILVEWVMSMVPTRIADALLFG